MFIARQPAEPDDNRSDRLGRSDRTVSATTEGYRYKLG
jgi:hypothetical protein